EHVLRIGERRLPDPRGALAAHLRERPRVAVHPGRHVMAADAANRAAAFRHSCRSVVRATRAEVRLALHVDVDGRETPVLLLEEAHALLYLGARMKAPHALREDPRDERWRELACPRQQPLAAFVLLADDQRPALRVPVVELLLELALDDAAFLLDDDDLLETLGELPNRLGFERPAHADLEQLDPDVAGARGVQPEIVERLQHVEVRFAGRDEAEPRIPAVDDRAVEGVRTRERERRRQLIPVQAQLLIVW